MTCREALRMYACIKGVSRAELDAQITQVRADPNPHPTPTPAPTPHPNPSPSPSPNPSRNPNPNPSRNPNPNPNPNQADLLFRLGSWHHALGALSPAGSAAAREAYHAGSRCLLESAQQFAFVCGREEKPTRAARELAALCMRSLKAARG